MNYADFTRELPTLRRVDRATCTYALRAPVVRETLKTGCTTCGSRWHGRLACPMRDEEKDVKP